MIFEDNENAISDCEEYYTLDPKVERSYTERCVLQIKKTKEIRDKDTHNNLLQNLVEHI